LLSLPPAPQLFATLIVIFFAIGLHEYAHAKLADAAGDPTPSIYGRVTLNLTKHFEPLGTLMIIITSLTGFGIGWGRPVPMDPRKMRNPRWDHFAAVAAGPISNLLQAVVYALLLRVLVSAHSPLLANQFVSWLLLIGVLVNLSLMVFNLLPLGPLDGHWLLGTFLPEDMRYRWYLWNRQMGSLILLVVVLGSQFMRGPNEPGLLWRVMGPPITAMFTFLTGLPAPF
jgi:Zn-dependent protease